MSLTPIKTFSNMQEETETARLIGDDWLSDYHITKSQTLLQKQFSDQNSLQNPRLLANRLQWDSRADNFVQIFHVVVLAYCCTLRGTRWHSDTFAVMLLPPYIMVTIRHGVGLATFFLLQFIYTCHNPFSVFSGKNDVITSWRTDDADQSHTAWRRALPVKHDALWIV